MTTLRSIRGRLFLLLTFLAVAVRPVAAAPEAPPAATPADAKPSKPKAPEVDAPAVHKETIKLASGKESIDAYVVRPDRDGTFPGVVISHEWWGLNAQIKGVADRLARAGYAVIVPDLYHGFVTDDPEKAHELLRGLPDDRGVADLRAAAAWLRSAKFTQGKKLGIAGFCMGGGLAIESVVGSDLFAACASFYGLPRLGPEEVAKVNAPILGLYGLDDQGITEETVRNFEASLKKLSKPIDVTEYKGAGHAFFNETRPAYRPDAAADAWKRLLDFYEKKLGS